MTDHIVDQIAEKALDLLCDTTDAEERVSRDRPPTNYFEPNELPAIDVRIGPDDPIDDQVQNSWRNELTLYVDLYVAIQRDIPVSRALLALRKDSYKVLLASMPVLSGVGEVIQILPGGAEEVLISDQGQTPVGYLRTVFFVTYQHSLTDPSQ